MGTVDVGIVEDAPGTCVLGKRGHPRAEACVGPSFRDGWKEEIMKQLEREQLNGGRLEMDQGKF